jgi:hypothetical protein
MFNNPIALKQIRVDSNGTLPLYEVKDQGERHAIIVFNGGIEGLIINVESIC